MPVALTEDHARLAESVRAFVSRHAEISGTRDLLPQCAAGGRVTIGSGMGATHDVLSRVRDALRAGALQADEPDVLAATGALAADHIALDALGLRATLRRLSGLEPGAASSLLKLGSALADRRAAGVALDLLGADGALNKDEHGLVARELHLPSVLIGGGRWRSSSTWSPSASWVCRDDAGPEPG